MLELFTTSTCTKCAVLEKGLENAGIPFVKCVIDVDPEVQTDTLMLGRRNVPTLIENRQIIDTEMIAKVRVDRSSEEE